jgi:nucleotide-binding universal stress UspA family protein
MTMAYKAVMVDAGLGTEAEARVRLAAGLVGHFGARLIGLAACGVRPPVGPPLGQGILVADILEAEVQRVSAMLRSAADRFRLAAGEAAEWRSFLEYPDDALTREARAADLVVTGRGGELGPSGFHQSAGPGDVLMRAGRPVLIVPPGVTALEARRVLVAWKESREARRAVADALPFLVRAERVVVLEVCDKEEDRTQAQRNVNDVAALLSLHGAKASGEVAVQGARSTAAELLRAAEQFGADLVVAGGYGHTRLLEWVFGGVTGDLLATCPVCCLLSH